MPEPEVCFLTFNVGLLKIKLMGRSMIETPPHVDARFEAILEKLPIAVQEHGVDVLALQEIYSDSQVALLMERLPTLPYKARVANHHFWQFHNGLLFLSKWPLTVSIQKHKQSSALESVFASKSCLVAKMETPIGKIAWANLHTTAGGGADPEAGAVDQVRQSELQEAVNLCTAARADGYAPLIVGDLNCGPESSAENYEFLSDCGFQDLVLPFAESIGCTWDPTSPLNNMTVFANSPACRIDHVFADSQAPVEASKAVKVFTEEDVTVPGKGKRTAQQVGLSDHFGVLVHLRQGKPTSPTSVAVKFDP